MPSLASFQNTVKDYIADNQTQEAIRALLRVDNTDLKNQIIILSSRLKALKRNSNLGLLDQAHIETEQVQINHALVEITDDIKEDTIINKHPDKKY